MIRFIQADMIPLSYELPLISPKKHQVISRLALMQQEKHIENSQQKCRSQEL